MSSSHQAWFLQISKFHHHISSYVTGASMTHFMPIAWILSSRSHSVLSIYRGRETYQNPCGTPPMLALSSIAKVRCTFHCREKRSSSQLPRRNLHCSFPLRDSTESDAGEKHTPRLDGSKEFKRRLTEEDLMLRLQVGPEGIDAGTSDDSSATLTLETRKDEVLSGISGAGKGGRKLAIVFTCKVCGTRSAKKFTEQAYRHGVVLVRCPGCENLHLIADRLGYFEDRAEGGWDIQKFVEKMGGKVTTVTDENVIEFTKDIVDSK